ncbi:hypothetical protein QFC22_005915 [Naganishia vaughanmartiniae]|uniref:Uncharacterized protein n=1 Tax=Naganishia vaughanmartiniae TaxID=1424756 RepID=A0ACC2WRF3_9TREE|nr:hypothetical protein QFC22_005915 [Naganishia vaughanmartiniae]
MSSPLSSLPPAHLDSSEQDRYICPDSEPDRLRWDRRLQHLSYHIVRHDDWLMLQNDHPRPEYHDLPPSSPPTFSPPAVEMNQSPEPSDAEPDADRLYGSRNQYTSWTPPRNYAETPAACSPAYAQSMYEPFSVDCYGEPLVDDDVDQSYPDDLFGPHDTYQPPNIVQIQPLQKMVHRGCQTDPLEGRAEPEEDYHANVAFANTRSDQPSHHADVSDGDEEIRMSIGHLGQFGETCAPLPRKFNFFESHVTNSPKPTRSQLDSTSQTDDEVLGETCPPLPRRFNLFDSYAGHRPSPEVCHPSGQGSSTASAPLDAGNRSQASFSSFEQAQRQSIVGQYPSVAVRSIARPTAVPTSSRQARQRVTTAAQRENLVSPSPTLPRITVPAAPLSEVPPASPLLERMDITIQSVLSTQDDSTQGDNSPVLASAQPAHVPLTQTEAEELVMLRAALSQLRSQTSLSAHLVTPAPVQAPSKQHISIRRPKESKKSKFRLASTGMILGLESFDGSDRSMKLMGRYALHVVQRVN